jgi:UDP-MurNAc hydroxylase
VLLTQFSYAAWVGNPGEIESMRRAAREKRQQMDMQIAAFQPRFLIPFASFVWFCRTDNFHLNDGINSIADIYAAYRDGGRKCVVLYPGDVWSVGQEFASERSVERYTADMAAHRQPVDLQTPATTMEQLEGLSRAQQEKLGKENALWALRPLVWAGVMKPVRIYIRDLGIGITYSCVDGIVERGVARELCDIELSTDSLSDIFKVGYASDTLLVNGRFREIRPGGRFVFLRNFMVPRYNDHGEYVPGLLVKPSFLKQHLGKLVGREA